MGKTRAAHLETEIPTMAVELEQSLRTAVKAEDMRAIYKAAFTTKLDEYVVKQAATPYRADAHAVANLIYARYFTLLASSPHMPEVESELIDQFKDMGLSEKDAENLFVTIAQHRGQSPIATNRVASYLTDQGVKPNEPNMQSMAKVIAAAYRNACIDATEAMGMGNPAADVWPLPGALINLLNLEQGIEKTFTDQPAAPVISAEAASPEYCQQAPDSQSTTTSPPLNGREDALFSAVVAKAIRDKTENGDWDSGRKRDLNAVMRLFIAANGDLPLSQIGQKHCKAMTDLFPKMPTRYGHIKEDIEEGIEGALARGARLKILWDADPIKAEADQVPTLGLSSTTHNKHLTWLSAIFEFADQNELITPSLDLNKLRKSPKKGSKKSQKRRAWLTADLKTLLSGTIWSGCAGLWHRFVPGEEIYHDGYYFGPLLIATSGARSEEATGLMLADIFDNAPIPYMYFRDTPYRRLKNDQSERCIPISPKLISLGFLDYVREMRKLGHTLLFPEFYNSKESMSFDHIFYDKVFEPLREFHFPDGTSRKVGRKDVDVHSIRTFAATFTRDKQFEPGLRHYMLGHVPDGETAASYEEEPDLSLVLPLVTALEEVITHLEHKPLHLRPCEWQKFGSPRGRRRSAKALR